MLNGLQFMIKRIAFKFGRHIFGIVQPVGECGEHFHEMIANREHTFVQLTLLCEICLPERCSSVCTNDIHDRFCLREREFTVQECALCKFTGTGRHTSAAIKKREDLL